MPNFIWQHKLEIASILVFLALAGVSIWDAILIIKDYQEDNTYTLVKFIEINESDPSKPFLKNQRLEICLSYGQKTIFKEVWLNSSITDQPSFSSSNDDVAKNIEVLLGKFSTGLVDINFAHDYLTLSDHRNIIKFFNDVIEEVDRNLLECIVPGPNRDPLCVNYDERLNNTEYLSLIDFQILAQLEDIVWMGMKQDFIQGEGPVDGISLDYWDEKSVCINIDLHEVIFPTSTGSDSGPSCSLTNIMPPRGQERWNSDEFSISLKTPSSNRKSTVTVDPSSVMWLTLAIDNVGMLNREITQQPCTNETKLVIPEDINHDQCQFRRYLRATVEKCGCIPISYRRQWQKLEPQSRYQPIKYCTPAMNAQCRNLVKDALDNALACPPACSVVKNRFTISNVSVAGNPPGWAPIDNNGGPITRTRLDLVCKDMSYVYFEEKFQLSPSQLLSQVGGDIGLYTGISMLSIWQVFVFICNLYGSYSRMRHEEKAEAATKRATFGNFVKRIIGLASATQEDDSKARLDQQGKDIEKIWQVLKKLDVKDITSNSGRRRFGRRISAKHDNERENMQMDDV